MSTHVHQYDGLGNLVQGLDLGSIRSPKAAILRVLAPVGKVVGKAFIAIAASREAQAIAEIQRFDHRFADEVRTASQRDLGDR